MRRDQRIQKPLKKRFHEFTTGLTGQLLLITVLFVVIAELLIFLPTIADMRVAWLNDRLSSAASIAYVMDGLQADLPREQQEAALRSMGVDLIAIRRNDTSRLLAVVERPLKVDAQYDIREINGIEAIRDAVDVLFNSQQKVMRVIGAADEVGSRIEIVMNSSPLRDAMLNYLANVALTSIALSIIIGSLIFVTFNRLLVKPIRRLSDGMLRFSERPDDPTRIYRERPGRDELAIASQQLAKMQESLHFALKQRKNLADLGLAVSKINHDMRNILASAQLMSDRLIDVSDPIVRSFAPRLVRTLDRAVSYTDELLAFGQTKERLPKRQDILLKPLVFEIKDVVLLGLRNHVQFDVQMADDLIVKADAEQIFRIIYNLTRNAVQALEQDTSESALVRRLVVSAESLREVVSIVVDDNGPGMPQKARENIFSAFTGSVRAGGTGLGLVIVRELVLAHGGTIALVEKPGRGTQFRIEISN